MMKLVPIMSILIVVITIFLNISVTRAFRLLSKPQLMKTTVCSSKSSFKGLKQWKNFQLSSTTSETFKFESNVSRVMDIIINSLYSNKDVFIRELISNSADACDKKRYLSLTADASSSTFPTKLDDLKIRVHANREANTLTIEDTGIGMNKADLIQNLGRIAESGTKKFMETLGKEKKNDVSLIGQFGVGFYSGFLVANKMTVITRGSEGEQLQWEASADQLDQYSITADTSDTLFNSLGTTGTRIILHLKDESDQYLDDMALKQLIERYSEFIAYPIELQRTVNKPESVPDTSKEPEADGTIPMKTVMTKTEEWGIVNTKKPLWLRSPKECSEDDYNEFYRQTFNAYDTPASHSHFNVEGNVDFKALLFLPSEVPYELTRDMFAASARSLRLYVKRVFINDKFEDLIPRWLLFVRGVVDSDDLPLNVGREILQQSRSLRIIRQRLVKKTIDMISDLSTNSTSYNTFWKNFGKYIKVGVIEDEKVREDLIPLCRFFSSHSGENFTSLPEYVSRMPADQKYIYYSVGETRAQAAMSPAMERLKSKGYEVIYISEPIDEMTFQSIEKYNDKEILDIARETTNDLTEDEKKEKETKNESSEELRKWMKDILGNRIQRVEASARLVNSPATLVQSEYGVSPNMQKYLRAQAVVESDEKGNFENIFNQAVLEINPSHPIIEELKRLQESQTDTEKAKELVELVFNTAALSAGYALDNAAEYSQMVVKMLTRFIN